MTVSAHRLLHLGQLPRPLGQTIKFYRLHHLGQRSEHHKGHLSKQMSTKSTITATTTTTPMSAKADISIKSITKAMSFSCLNPRIDVA